MSKPINPSRFVSNRHLLRKPSAIRKLVQKGLATPGTLSLAGGLPNPDFFPFTGFQATLRSGETLSVETGLVKEALQYSSSYGLPRLVKRLEGLQREYHSPQVDVKLCVGTGSQSLLARCFDLLLNPGDALLLENPTYPGSLAALAPMAPNFVPIDTDGDGLIPASLHKALSEWDGSRGDKPKVLYTIPVGQNPSGATLSESRRVEIYRIAQEHDLMIIEDDPYYFLYLGGQGEDAGVSKAPASFLSMDTDGRVIRFDSLSKILSSGFRLGFVTGHPELVERIQVDIQCSELHTSGVSQAFAVTLLEKWESEGWVEHVAAAKRFYAQRRDTFLKYCDKHLKGLAEWTVPAAGMFLWLRLLNCDDSFELISEKAQAEKVLLVPGVSFDPLGRTSPYVRAAYSTATDEVMDEALRRLSNVLRSA